MHHLARPRLRRLRGLRDHRRGADALRRGAPAAGRAGRASERPEGTTVIAGTGSNDTRHAVPPDRARRPSWAPTPSCRSRRTTTSPTGAGCARHYEEIARATDKPIVLYNIPSRVGPRPAQRPAGRAGADRAHRRTSSRPTTTNLGADRRPRALRRQRRRSSRARSTSAAPAASSSASHVVGDEMRRMVDEPEQPRARSTRRLQRRLRGAGRHHQPDPASRPR